MTYFSSTHTIATAATGRPGETIGDTIIPETTQRTWRGKAKDETVQTWLRSNGLHSAHVAVHGIHKGRSVRDIIPLREVVA